MGSEGDLPRVSAVVTAHDRTAFLAEAVRSALASGADEILVVRNFGGAIAGCEGRYRDLRCDAPETAEKEARGLEAASGEVVGFLDDDDLWEPTKVARLRALFGPRPDLVYYCHGHRPVDAAGRPVEASHPELVDKDAARFSTWDREDFEQLVRTVWPGNNSSTVVRRAWGVGWLPWLRETGWSVDMFWLVAALLGGRGFEIGPDPLTRLRLHERNMSQTRGSDRADFRRRHGEASERFARSTSVLARLASERTGPDSSMSRYLRERAAGYRFFADLESGASPRRSALRALRAGAGRTDRAVWGSAIITIVAPTGARRLLYRSSQRRWGLR